MGQGILGDIIRKEAWFKFKIACISLAVLVLSLFIRIGLGGNTTFILLAVASVPFLIVYGVGAMPIISVRLYKYVRMLPKGATLADVENEYAGIPKGNLQDIGGGCVIGLTTDYLFIERKGHVEFYDADDFYWAFASHRTVTEETLHKTPLHTTVTITLEMRGTRKHISERGDMDLINKALMPKIARMYPWIATGYQHATMPLKDMIERSKTIQRQCGRRDIGA